MRNLSDLQRVEQSLEYRDTGRPSSTPTPVPSPTRVLSFVNPFRTARDAFGILREYSSHEPPSHDPEAYLDFPDLCDGHGKDTVDLENQEDHPLNRDSTFFDPLPSTAIPQLSLGPYPNESSLLLGDWYWNSGRQKSVADFRSLLAIIGRPDFRPEDVRDTKWGAINAKLGANSFDNTDTSTNDNDDSDSWLDDDASWIKSPITISVPFHKRAKHPGAKDFYVGDLYHRSLTSVIRERLTNPQDAQLFHYEPFELLWQPDLAGPETRVHGEIYTSPQFLKAHSDLQASPNEPGCILQKVVVAMMFLSDVTHLTQFGTAKLWPCYLMFGNDSKYRRCKPTCNLCSHVAYFQTVSVSSLQVLLRQN